MRILVLTGIQEELLPLLELHDFAFDRGVGAYRSKRSSEVYAATTGPGVKKARELRRLLESVVPHVIVNGGLTGLLKEEDDARAGDRLRLGSVVDRRTGVIYPGGPGRDRLVSVEAPLFEPADKMDVALDFQARACEMEAAHILRIVGQIEEVSSGSVVIFCKVVGDRPDSYHLFQHEHLVRAWHRKQYLEKWWAGLRFPGGPWRLQELLAMKETALASLGRRLAALIDRIVRAKGVPAKTDSIFIPH